jgi:hypothetical protein
MISGAILNPTSDGFPVQLNIHDEASGYQIQSPAEVPPPAPKPVYASSYDTDGAIPADAAHYENRQISLNVRVFGTSHATLESRLNALYNMVGQINREGGVLKITTPNGTVCYFDLVQEATATATVDKLYEVRDFTFVDCQFQARPFWRGAEQDLGSVSEADLPALVGTFPAGGFDSPEDIAGLEVWLRPESLSAVDNSAVSAWSNEGSGADAVQATGGFQPTVQTNELDGFSIVRFDGSDDRLTVSDVTNNDATRTVFIVAKQAANTDQRTVWGWDNNARLRNSAVGGATWGYLSNQAVTEVDLGGTTTNWTAVTVRYNSTSSVDAYINGGAAQNFDPNDVYQSGSTQLHIGSRDTGINPWNGDVAEVIIYNSVLSDANKDKVLGYLSDKYPTLGAFGTAPTTVEPVKGDVYGLGRAVFTDTQNVDRQRVDIAGQSRYRDSAATAALFYPATDLTPVGSSTDTGSVIRNTDLTTSYQAVLKSEIDATNAALTHKGSFRVMATLQRPTGNTGAVSVKLEWGVGDYTRVTRNDADTVHYAADEREGVDTVADLGLVHIAPSDDQWEFRILAKSTVPGDEIDVRDICLFPCGAPGERSSYIKLSARVRFEAPSTYTGRSEFATESGAITGDSAGVGGAWSGFGDATDISVAGGVATRSEINDAANTGRFVTLNTNQTNTAVQIDTQQAAATTTAKRGVVARHVDATNWFRATLNVQAVDSTVLRVQKSVSGTVTDLVPPLSVFIYPLSAISWFTIRAVVFAGGAWFVWAGQQNSTLDLLASGSDTALATGGALATGDPGFVDENETGVSVTRSYDNFFSFAATPDAAVFSGQSLELRHDGADRENSAGTIWSPVSDRPGKYFLIAPAGPEGRSTRIIARGYRQNPDTGSTPGTDDNSLQVYATPRGLVVPEA